jgi:hypothetical protein
VDEAAAVRRALVLAFAAALAAAALCAGPAGAADECNGLRVCLPVNGPWVVADARGADWELACPLRNYVVGGTDVRVATRDVDVSFRAEIGSPIGPGVSTGRSVVFHGARTGAGGGSSSYQPYIGCIPSSGGGGRALTAYTAGAPGFKVAKPLFSVAVTVPVVQRTQTVRAACPAPSRLVGATHAVGFDEPFPPSPSQRGSVRVRRAVVEGVVVARVTADAFAGPSARVQVRALCSRIR